MLENFPQVFPTHHIYRSIDMFFWGWYRYIGKTQISAQYISLSLITIPLHLLVTMFPMKQRMLNLTLPCS